MTEEQKLIELVDEFAAEMKRKLLRKKRHGFKGWNDTKNKTSIQEGLRRHVESQILGISEQEVDIANFAAMLWSFNGRKMA